MEVLVHVTDKSFQSCFLLASVFKSGAFLVINKVIFLFLFFFSVSVYPALYQKDRSSNQRGHMREVTSNEEIPFEIKQEIARQNLCVVTIFRICWTLELNDVIRVEGADQNRPKQPECSKHLVKRQKY